MGIWTTTDWVVIGILLFAVVGAGLWVWAAARNVKAIDREMVAMEAGAKLALLKRVGLHWYKDELYRGPPLGGGDCELFLVMQTVWPEETAALGAEWAMDTDPGPHQLANDNGRD